MSPVVRVVGLGPGGPDLVTVRTREIVRDAALVRLRTRRHPGAGELVGVASYDELYEGAGSFDELYEAIVDDLVTLASTSPTGEVVYVVPGSPVVAERTVELLRERADVTLVLEGAVSVIDVACATLGVDPMSVGLRVVDALGSLDNLRGPGPLLVLQAYSPEVLAHVGDRLAPATAVTVLHHLGLADEVVTALPAGRLASFDRADHLTSLWVGEVRDAATAVGDLVELFARLRRECPWDQEQTHASLTRHLLEEAYEVIDALETYVRVDAPGSHGAAAHLEEELGDLLGQIVFHALLGEEDDSFTLATIADALKEKLISRHPHVFGDVVVADSNEVAARWETLKRDEKGRASVVDGVAWQLPALTLYTKLLRKSALIETSSPSGDQSRLAAVAALRTLRFDENAVNDAQSSSDADPAWGSALEAVVAAAQFAGVDLEGVLRERARVLADAIRVAERSA